jgi:hypothetical protein
MIFGKVTSLFTIMLAAGAAEKSRDRQGEQDKRERAISDVRYRLARLALRH